MLHPCRSLAELEHLEELHLLGNPCARWPGYRPYVLGTLPRLQNLDGETVGAYGRVGSRPQLLRVQDGSANSMVPG